MVTRMGIHRTVGVAVGAVVVSVARMGPSLRMPTKILTIQKIPRPLRIQDRIQQRIRRSTVVVVVAAVVRILMVRIVLMTKILKLS
jgi:hypothetical protein